MKVAVIHGGNSTEAEISTLNASYVIQALEQLGHEAKSIEYNLDMVPILLEYKPDRAFLCVQGKGHGDGTLQGILEYLNIPYTGSKREAATIINNKIFCQKLFEENHIPVAPHFTWKQSEYVKVTGPEEFQRNMKQSGMKFPCVAKAPTQGGSFGIALLQNLDDYSLMEEIFTYDSTILIEQFIQGSFYTVGILQYHGKRILLPVMEGKSLEKDQNMTKFLGEYCVVKANLSKEIEENMQDYANRAFECVDAVTYARADFMLDDETNIPYMLEINAVPGIKPSSLFPPAVALLGISYEEMIEAILIG